MNYNLLVHLDGIWVIFVFFSLSCFLKTPSGSKSDVILHIFLEEVLMNTFLPTEIDMKELSYK